MSATASVAPIAQVPPHVPPELVRHVDVYNIPGAATDVHAAWKRIQDDSPDIFFTPCYEGYWVVTRAPLIDEVLCNADVFSSACGTGIPRAAEGATKFLPIEADGELRQATRVPLNAALSPKAIQNLPDQMRALTAALIEGFKQKGRCDFVADFAKHVPMEVFLRLVELPVGDREWLIERAEIINRNPNPAARTAAFADMFAYLERWIAERAANPGSDAISKVTQVKIGDRPLSHNQMLATAGTLMFGGLDTVAGAMSFLAYHLAIHPEDRHRVAGNPEIVPQAVEELLRRYGIPTVSRTLARDFELGGVQMKEGDNIMIPIMLSGLDERSWRSPMQTDFDRDTRGQIGFGKGVHHCPGTHLARAELRIFLEEWLKRIPNFSLDPDRPPVFTSGYLAGVLSLPLVWDPASVA